MELLIQFQIEQLHNSSLEKDKQFRTLLDI